MEIPPDQHLGHLKMGKVDSLAQPVSARNAAMAGESIPMQYGNEENKDREQPVSPGYL